MTVGRITFDFPPQYNRADVAKRPTAFAAPRSPARGARDRRRRSGSGACRTRPGGGGGHPRRAGPRRVHRGFSSPAHRLPADRGLPLGANRASRERGGPTERSDSRRRSHGEGGTASLRGGDLREHARGAAQPPLGLLEAFLDTTPTPCCDGSPGRPRIPSCADRASCSGEKLWAGDALYEKRPRRSRSLLSGRSDDGAGEVLVERADEIVASDHLRIDSFIDWLKGHGVESSMTR